MTTFESILAIVRNIRGIGEPLKSTESPSSTPQNVHEEKAAIADRTAR